MDCLRSNPNLLRDLAGLMSLPDNKVEEAVTAMSTGAGGERLRRVMADTGFENPQDKINFIKEVWNQFEASHGAKSAVDIMWGLRPQYVMKGKLAKNDAAWNAVPIAKGITTGRVDRGKCGTVDRGDSQPKWPSRPRGDPSMPGAARRAQAGRAGQVARRAGQVLFGTRHQARRSGP